MSKSLSLLLAFVVAFSLSGVPARVSAIEGAPVTDIPYMEDGSENHLLDLYGADPEVPRPVVLDIHGGGFFGGTKENNVLHNELYADAGFAVIAMNYTLMPESDFVTIEQELFSVLHWVEDHAAEYGLDTDRVVISGDSAGGFLSLLTASILASPDLQEYYAVTPPSYEVQAYVLSCPVTDLASLRDAEKGFKSFMASKMNPVIFEDETVFNHADLYQLIDPSTFPEVYFVTTPTDANFYPDSVALDSFLTEKGISHQFHEYVGAEKDLNHVFNVSEPDTVEGTQANQESLDYLYGLLGMTSLAEEGEGAGEIEVVEESEEETAVEEEEKTVSAVEETAVEETAVEETVAEADAFSIWCIGDSLTYGVMPGTAGKREVTYPDTLAALLGEGYEVTNVGKPGRSLTSQGVSYLGVPEYQESIEAAADMYILMLGTNDANLWEKWDAQEYEQDLYMVTEAYQEANPRTKLVLIAPPTVLPNEKTGETKMDKDLLEGFIHDTVEKVASEKGALFIDLFAETTAHPEMIGEDGIHLTQEGYKAVGELIYESIREFL